MAEEATKEDFPWHLGLYDAHCHPTDTMSSIQSIQSMKTRILTVMATRAEDQDLVLQAANLYSVKSSSPSQWSREECIVPCFGWHPWFSHQMYIDTEPQYSNLSGPLTGDSKIKHYESILRPQRDEFRDQNEKIYLTLPDPTPFSQFLVQMRKHLEQFPYALVGEIGLDNSFRIPESWTANTPAWATRNHNLTPGGREGRRLTPFRCHPSHQKKILSLQLQLAAELGRAVSVHGVQAHGLVFEVLSELWKGNEKEVLSKRERKKRGQDHPDADLDMSTSTSSPNDGEAGKKALPYPPRICLHSYSGNVSNFKQYLNRSIPCLIYASFSTAINLGDALDDETPKSFEEVVKAVPDHLVLVESDLHTAGEEMDRRMEDIVRRICKVKGWELEEGVMRLGRNWRMFAFGVSGDEQ